MKGTRLWSRLAEEPELEAALLGLRGIAAEMGSAVARTLPGYTDHSIRHMDALWTVTDQVLLPTEVERVTPAEAFVLGASFYVHDLGMAFAATSAGALELRRNEHFAPLYERALTVFHLDDKEADRLALEVTTRLVHGEKAMILVTELLPGLGRYLIENSEVRGRWATWIGEVSASHHWSLAELERRLGARDSLPSPYGVVDLGYIACVLRVVDFAHISSDRARYLERLLRGTISSTSLVHWRAQEAISGPLRVDDLLKYVSFSPIYDSDAWWLFFEMIGGLDTEIRSCQEYLAARTCSYSRFALKGVLSANRPIDFATLVLPDGFEPVDVRLKADSIERLVKLLGGRALYGSDGSVAVRELIQNARDAIELRSLNRAAFHTAGISVNLTFEHAVAKLTVSDDGVGMGENQLINYLLGIASDYWESSDYFNKFPGLASKFRPAGRFGVGFLSVFMLADQVDVETEEQGGSRLRLSLYGLGRRGVLRRGIGTGPLCQYE